jgi:DNA invertase Pin-like site-specific DNA recombinase
VEALTGFGRTSVLLARISTDSQDHALQLDALRAAGCDKVCVETASGTRTNRPELTRHSNTRQSDVLMVWRLDRLARSLRPLIDIADDLNRRGVASSQSPKVSAPRRRAVGSCFNILGALSSMEREMIVERTHAGLIAAAARGRRGGRPPALDEAQIRAAKAMLASGEMSATEVAQQVGCAPSTLYRHLPGGRTALAQIGLSLIPQPDSQRVRIPDSLLIRKECAPTLPDPGSRS